MGATERWFVIEKITVHTENDGYTMMRRGLEANDEEISLDEAVKMYGKDRIARALREKADELEKK